MDSDCADGSSGSDSAPPLLGEVPRPFQFIEIKGLYSRTSVASKHVAVYALFRYQAISGDASFVMA